MDRNELLKYLICEIDLVMHDKDYRFENEDGTWYSRESCKNLTNEEVFEELKGELRQLAKIEDDFADLEAKLAESEYKVQTLLKSKDVLAVTDIAKMSVDNFNLRKENQQLKQQLAEKNKEIEEAKDVPRLLIRTYGTSNCNGKNQTAIAELEKVKEKAIKPKDYGWCDKYKDCWDIVMDIDQQIAELKGEK